MMTLALALLALAPQQGTPSSGSNIWDRLKFTEAQGRIRGEATFDNVDANTGNDIDDRYRGRLRFRLGAAYKLDDQLDLYGRLSTASDGNDANNPHWDFGDGDGFNGSGIVMDRFYVDWKPSEEMHVLVGKQPHAFSMPPIFGEFLWDADVSPSGVAAVWKPKTSEGTSFDARVAGYVATEVAADEDPKVYAAQGNMYLPVDDAKVQVSTSIYDWKDNNDGTTVAGNQGNSSTTEAFLTWEGFVAATIPGGPLDEMTGYLQVMDNLHESDHGFVIGAQLGASKWVRGNYNAWLLFYDFDGDAFFSPVAQDDTPVPGLGLNDGNAGGMDGVVLGGQYFWRDNIAFKLWVLTSNADGADSDPVRVRLDLDFKLM